MQRFGSDSMPFYTASLGPSYGAIAVPSVTRCRCRRCPSLSSWTVSDTCWMGVRRLALRMGPTFFKCFLFCQLLSEFHFLIRHLLQRLLRSDFLVVFFGVLGTTAAHPCICCSVVQDAQIVGTSRTYRSLSGGGVAGRCVMRFRLPASLTWPLTSRIPPSPAWEYSRPRVVGLD